MYHYPSKTQKELKDIWIYLQQLFQHIPKTQKELKDAERNGVEDWTTESPKTQKELKVNRL